MLAISRIGLSLFLLCATTISTLTAQDRPTLRAGAFAQDITPTKFPISSNGNMSDRMARQAHDRLHARCVVLASGPTQLALAVCDSCMIPRELMDAAKAKASQKTGIPAANILISATHSHSCPTVTGVFQSDPDAEYIAFLIDRIADGITVAHSRLQPARVGWGAAQEPGQLFNRRWHLKEGVLGENPFGQKVDTVRMNPGYSNPDVTTPAGSVDPEVAILAIQTADGAPLALLANYSLHYVGGVGGEDLSADYFGEFAHRVGRALKVSGDHPFVGILSNGTSGDVNNVNFSLTAGPKRQPYEQMGLVAEAVAQAAKAAWDSVEFQSSAKLAAATREIELGVRLPSVEDLAQAEARLAAVSGRPLKGAPEIYARETVLLAKYPATVKSLIQAMRIGDLGIVSSPCETFTETGLAIKAGSPLKKTFTIELANGYNGYLPPPAQHDLGGYETWRARSSYLARDAEPKIRATQLELLRQVAAD